MSENIHPAKNKAPSFSSPMKDEPEDHMVLSSPHFRPAAEQNLTVDLKKAQQQQQSSSQQYPSQIPGRKSLGRRVSFAATAHVRLYDKADSDREDEKGGASAGEEEEDLDFRPASKKGSLKGSPKPPTAHSPSGPSRPSRLSESFTLGEDNSAPSTPSVRRQSESPSLTRFSTVTNYSTLNETGGRDSPNSIASFDVDIKDVNSSSFTSYHSGGEEDETIELSQIGPRTDNDVDMEFTSCVGGILAKADASAAPTPKQPEDDNTMDLTVCVGGIIRRLPGIRLSDASCASSVDTMELTECVGKIIARQQGLPSTPVRAEDDMDMTMVVDRTIHCRDDEIVGEHRMDRMGSPSPFLVATPAKALPAAAGITFIGDIGEPDAFKLLGCVSPMPNQAAESMDQRIFHTFIDTDKCSDAPTPVHQHAALPHNTQFTQSYDTLPSTLASAGQSLKASLSVLNTPKRSIAVGQSLLAQSSFAASSLSLPSQQETGPTASLADFLNETGIRFLENISSLKRRETTGRPRDSDIVAPSKQAFIASALLPQLDFFESAAEDLVPEIMGAKEVLGQQESQFAIQPPLAFLQYQRGDAATRQLILAKLKTLKSVARLFSKQQWHQWRLQRQAALNKAMEANLEALLCAWDPLQAANAQLDALTAQLEPQYRELYAELAALEHLRAFPDEIEQARQMEETVADQSTQLAEMDADLAELERQEAALHRAITEASAQKDQLSAKIEASKQALATTPKVTELLLNEMRSLLALRKAVCGWEFVQVRPDTLTIRYLLGGPVLIKLDFDATSKLVHSVSLSGHQAKLSIFRHAHRLQTGTGKQMHETLAEVFATLDSIAQVERQLASSALNMHCSFELLPETSETVGHTGLDFKLCFFSYESRSKFDISLSISSASSRLVYTGFTHHYGPIEEHDVRDYIGLALSSASSIEKTAAACKQIVTSVQGLIAEHAVDGRPSDAFSLCLHSNDQLADDPMVE